MAASLVSLQEVERLSARVLRILGGNPASGRARALGTNTYLVGTGPQRLLIDTGEGKPSWAKALRRVLDDEKATIQSTLITHWHPDHVGGIRDVLEICPKAQIFKNQAEGVQQELDDGRVFEVEGAALKALHAPGHAADHMCFVLPEEDAMFSGDNVLGQGTAVFEDLAQYLESLELMRTRFAGKIYPGHGPVIDDGPGKIIEYIQHRKQREEQIVAVLKDDTEEAKGMSSMAIVKIIYKDVREDLHLPAERGVLQVLHKLEQDGSVTNDSSTGLWKIAQSHSV